MKTKNIYQGIALLAMALTTAACQNELNEDTTQPQPGEKVNMTIRATQEMPPQTRTIYEDKLGADKAGNVVVKWEGGEDGPNEVMKVFGYETDALVFSTPNTFVSDPSTLDQATGLSISFTGTRPTGTKLLAVYPADNCKIAADGSLDFDFSKQTQKDNKDMAHLKKCDIMFGTEVTGSTNNNFKFEHKAIMLCFDLNLPTEEKVKLVTLENSIVDGIMNKASFIINGNNLLGYNEGDEKISVSISNPSSAKDWKVYMMVPAIDTDTEDATLTITVATNSGNTYEGKLTTVAGTKLTPGSCYTLKPNTTLTNKITIPPVAEGSLGNVLNDFTPDANQTDLALTGTVNDADITALVTFLKDPKSTNITTLDLSELTNINEVKGLAECPKVTTVILPNNAVAIGDGAFRDCKALTTVTQNDLPEENPETLTRASMPSRVTSVGANAFEGCTAMTEMFLHAKITKVGAYAFKSCTAMKALVFEGTYEVGAGLTLGTDILADCTHKDLNILLPAIKETEATKAATYKKALGKPTYYEYKGDYGTATDADKVKSTSYKASVPNGSGVGDFEPGSNWGK